MENVILSYFIISKNYFINYTIPFYNTLNIPKLYYFTILLKYYFLIFLYHFFPIVIFYFKFNNYYNVHIFNRAFASYQRSYFQHIQIYILPTVIFSTYIDPHTYIFNNLPIFFFFLERTCQISIYSNLSTSKIHIHIYFIKPAKYQCKIHIHIYIYIYATC